MKKVFTIIIVAVLILIPVGVFGWYILSKNVGVGMFGAKISKWDLIVSDTPGGKDLSEGELVDIQVSDFSNTAKGVLAPGTYGSIDLYIRTSSDSVSGYTIYIDESELKLGNDNEILQKHFKFYMDEALTKEINMENPFVGSIEYGKEAKATIYWHWVYDGSNDIPETLTEQAKIDEFLREWDLEDCFISENQEQISGNLKLYVSAYQEKSKQ